MKQDSPFVMGQSGADLALWKFDSSWVRFYLTDGRRGISPLVDVVTRVQPQKIFADQMFSLSRCMGSSSALWPGNAQMFGAGGRPRRPKDLVWQDLCSRGASTIIGVDSS